jgi:hypothetical protein
MEVEQDRQDLVAGDSVHRRVMDLGQQGVAAALQSADQVDLPQRPSPIQRAGDDPRHLVGELVIVARRGESDLTDVEVQVEVRILDPVRMVQTEGDVD